jgi:alkanesulfonate monooxygenase SsuD/methylene tetrahydromethanopterin reductase-like flavin-dependent oxidoreductase (luciferase family)
MGTLGGTPEAIASGLLAFRAAGVGHVVCMLDPRTEEGIERFAPVIELVRRAER